MKTVNSIQLSVTAPSRLLLAALAALAITGTPKPLAAVEPGEERIAPVLATGIAPAKSSPARGDESVGPYDRLVIRNAMLIDGTGAPARGPVDIDVEQDRIVAIRGSRAGREYEAGTEIIDASGQYVLPGFVDSHAHLGTPSHAPAGSLTDAEYVNKLWLAHGVTTVREVGAVMGLEWTLAHKRRSDKGEITAPRFKVLAMFPPNIPTVDAAIDWVRAVKKKGADGVKFLGADKAINAAAIQEAERLGMLTAQHHAQLSVTQMDVLDTARLGLDSMEHWYGLPEAMFEDRTVQHYPYDYNYNNEQDRFGEAGRLWLQAADPGSDTWNATIEELIELDFTLSPTFTIYEANRDLMREERAVWHDQYTMPYMLRAFRADPDIHGSYFFNWTTGHEIAWKQNFARWMSFVNDYKNRGGRVTTGSDSGFIWKTYGFGFVRELELLQEAGFHPLEVLMSATLKGAELVGMADEIGSVSVGKKADLIIVNENPIANFKVLYGTGHQYLDKNAGELKRTEGIVYTIKDGIVFDAKALLEDVRQLVAAEKAAEHGGL
jgi:imidazolonepropionase-like amidohydrolase